MPVSTYIDLIEQAINIGVFLRGGKLETMSQSEKQEAAQAEYWNLKHRGKI